MKNDLQRHVEKWNQQTMSDETNAILSLRKIHTRLKEQIDYIEREHAVLRKDYNTYLISLVAAPSIN